MSEFELAETALLSLFARRSPLEVSESQVLDLLASHGLRDEGDVRDVGRRLWSRALERFLADLTISDEEVRYLERLCRLFDISFDDTEEIKSRLLHPRYRQAVTEVEADGVLSSAEQRFLDDLRARLRLNA